MIDLMSIPGALRAGNLYTKMEPPPLGGWYLIVMGECTKRDEHRVVLEAKTEAQAGRSFFAAVALFRARNPRLDVKRYANARISLYQHTETPVVIGGHGPAKIPTIRLDWRRMGNRNFPNIPDGDAYYEDCVKYRRIADRLRAKEAPVRWPARPSYIGAALAASTFPLPTN